MKAAALAAVFAFTAGGAFAASADWRQDAKPEDAKRLSRLDEAWRLARKQAAAAPGELQALGGLAKPGAALPRPHPTPGDYRCRTVKLGIGGPEGGEGLIAYGWFRCRVDLSPGGDLTLRKTSGSQRPMGNLYPDDKRRLVYLGAVAWGDERSATYGRDPDRDQVGVFERIGPQRYRLVLPYPKQESTLDILELRR